MKIQTRKFFPGPIQKAIKQLGPRHFTAGIQHSFLPRSPQQTIFAIYLLGQDIIKALKEQGFNVKSQQVIPYVPSIFRNMYWFFPVLVSRENLLSLGIETTEAFDQFADSSLKRLPPKLIQEIKAEGFELSAHYYSPILKKSGKNTGEVFYAAILYEFSTGEKTPLGDFSKIFGQLHSIFCEDLGIQLPE